MTSQKQFHNFATILMCKKTNSEPPWDSTHSILNIPEKADSTVATVLSKCWGQQVLKTFDIFSKRGIPSFWSHGLQMIPDLLEPTENIQRLFCLGTRLARWPIVRECPLLTFGLQTWQRKIMNYEKWLVPFEKCPDTKLKLSFPWSILRNVTFRSHLIIIHLLSC